MDVRGGHGLGVRIALAFLMVCMILGPPAGRAWAAPVHIIDDGGRRVELPVPPRRIVTLLPSLTETVCVLDACDRLVATDRWSNWPARVRTLPKAGGLDDANVEMVLAQRPDLVLLSPSSRLAGRLRGLGLTVAELDAQDLDGVREVLRKVAVLLGQPQRAAARWQALQDDIHRAAASVPAVARGRRVYLEISDVPHGAGESSYLGQLLLHLGAHNIVPARLGPFPQLNPEYIVQAAPALIIVRADAAGALRARPGWHAIPAVKQGAVCGVPAGEYDLLSRPGPRLGQAAGVLARCLAVGLSASPLPAGSALPMTGAPSPLPPGGEPSAAPNAGARAVR